MNNCYVLNMNFATWIKIVPVQLFWYSPLKLSKIQILAKDELKIYQNNV